MSGFTSLGKKGSGGIGGGGGANANAIGPFGTALVSNLTPAAQAAFIYGINSTLWVTSSTGVGATVSSAEGVMSCTSGTSLSGSSHVKLSRSIKYRAGQGVVGRITAIFDPGQPDTKQLAGMGNEESGYYFCKNGSNFGILHRETSKREIRSFAMVLQGAETVTVTLGGESKTFSIDGGSNVNQTSYLISRQDYSQVGSGWKAESINGVVFFISDKPGPIGGTYGITKSGGVSIVSSAQQVQAGVLPTETFISQSLWNIDPMNGNGASRTLLDTSKGNIYGVGYQYLGFGDPVFSIENPESGLLVDVHRIQAANSKTSVVLRNPQTTARWEAINSGSSASSVTVKGASAGIFNEGLVVRNIGTAFAAAGSKATIDTLVPIITIRTDRVFRNQSCYGEADIFNMSLGCDAGSSATNKILRFYVYKNATLGGPVNFQKVDSNRSVVSYDTAATSVSLGGGQLLKSIIVAANSSTTLSLENENFFLTSGDTVTIAAEKAGSSNVDLGLVTLGWFEDQ